MKKINNILKRSQEMLQKLPHWKAPGKIDYRDVG